MKAFVLTTAMVALVPMANAEQGDAEDRALTEQMMNQMATREAQPTQTQTQPSADRVDSEKQANPVLQEKINTSNGQ
ncbi:hypothetical protein C9I57_07300 [Trinickia symbiotica]|uniref:DUF4148 domain-containing protein n=1 Tax=Trinickia symbiotica TaxID=863227 RepID=A0A2T3XY83_9BURK|nr:hypothetical protein [Trinickia symbiotica]PTB21452.1 hypothetical protein C9I57_07300 [Trinickia symbiotica]